MVGIITTFSCSVLLLQSSNHVLLSWSHLVTLLFLFFITVFLLCLNLVRCDLFFLYLILCVSYFSHLVSVCFLLCPLLLLYSYFVSTWFCVFPTSSNLITVCSFLSLIFLLFSSYFAPTCFCAFLSLSHCVTVCFFLCFILL